MVQKFANNETGLSRADIWALAVTVGVDVADHGSITQPINFTMNWFGRVDCENVNQVCLNMNGEPQPCTSTQGPTRIHASPTFNTDDVFDYFATLQLQSTPNSDNNGSSYCGSYGQVGTLTIEQA